VKIVFNDQGEIMLTNNSKDQSSTDIELARNAQIKKSRNDAISFGTTSFVLTILGFYLKSQSQFYNHQIMQYCSSIIFAIDLPFFIATTSSIFNFHSLKDFPDGSYLTLNKAKTPNLGNNLDVKKFQEFSDKKANRNLPEITLSTNSTLPNRTTTNSNFRKLDSKNDNQKYL
jgi:hypothetical protein